MHCRSNSTIRLQHCRWRELYTQSTSPLSLAADCMLSPNCMESMGSARPSSIGPPHMGHKGRWSGINMERFIYIDQLEIARRGRSPGPAEFALSPGAGSLWWSPSFEPAELGKRCSRAAESLQRSAGLCLPSSLACASLVIRSYWER